MQRVKAPSAKNKLSVLVLAYQRLDFLSSVVVLFGLFSAHGTFSEALPPTRKKKKKHRKEIFKLTSGLSLPLLLIIQLLRHSADLCVALVTK